MPMVAFIAVLVVGCGAVIWVASRSRQQSSPQRRRQFVPQQQDQVTPDSFGAYSAWQVAELATSDPAPILSDSTPVPAHTTYPDAAARDESPAGDDNACRVEPDSSSNFDVEREDPPAFEVERDDSCSTDSGSDSGSSDSSSSD